MKLDKKEIKRYLDEIFTGDENNLILAKGYGERVANYWDIIDFEEANNEELYDDVLWGNRYRNEAEYSNSEYATGIKFCTNYENPAVKVLGELLVANIAAIKENKLVLLCARNEYGNDMWDVVVCVNKDGDIVLHEVRDDGMISANVETIKEFKDYTI